MAPVKECLSIACSSEDPVHKVQNILKKTGKWLSNKEEKGRQIEALIHLRKAITIAYINIGNCGSAFIELQVGRSMWPVGKDYITLVPSTTLMSPVDSKTGTNSSSVKLLGQDSFIKGVTDLQWDCVKVVLRQPYNRNKQFGLEFLDIVETEVLESQKSNDSTKESSLAEFRSKLQIVPPNKPEPRIPTSLYTSPRSCRAAGLVEAALKGQAKPKISPERANARLQSTNYQKPFRVQRSSPYGEVDAQLQRRKSMCRKTAGDIEDEVECFLESFDFETLPLESVTYRHLKDQLEEKRGEKLSKAERKVFLRLAEKHVLRVVEMREKLEKEKEVEKKIIDVGSSDDDEKDNGLISSFFPYETTTNNITTDIPQVKDKQRIPDVILQCPVCDNFFPKTRIDVHANICAEAAGLLACC